MSYPTRKGSIGIAIMTNFPPSIHMMDGLVEDAVSFDLHSEVYELLDTVITNYFNCITDSYFEEGELFWELCQYKFL